MSNSKVEPITLAEGSVEYFKEYSYLGQLISYNNIMTKKENTRNANTWKGFGGKKK